MLLCLPAELLLSILKLLPVSSIAACRATNSMLCSFVDQHESTIYRQAASHPSLHLIPHDQIRLEDVPLLGWHSKRFLGRLGSWKDLCRRPYEVRSSWRGRGPSSIRKYDQISSDVHHIKVDEKRGFFIVTRQRSGLAVVEISSDRQIWSLPREYVRPRAQCDYGEGFLIFDRFDGSKEVWRLVSDDPQADPPSDFDVVPESLPDAAQIFHSRHSVSSGIRPIKFVAHALLPAPPDPIDTDAFCFAYPTLLVAGFDTLYLWDVRTGALVEQVENIQERLDSDIELASSAGDSEEADYDVTDGGGAEFSQAYPRNWELGAPPIEVDMLVDYKDQNEGIHPPERLGDIIRHVEVNDKYAIACGSYSLRMFRRGQVQPLNDIHDEDAGGRVAWSCVLELTPSYLKSHGKWFFLLGYVKQCDLPEDFRGWRERRKDKTRYRANARVPRRNEAHEKKDDDDMSVEGSSTSLGQHQNEEGIPLLGGAASGPARAVDEDSRMADVDRGAEDESKDDQRYQQSSDLWWRTDKAIVSHDMALSRPPGNVFANSEFQAAHISPCGQHLAILLAGCQLMIIPYFERIITGQVTDVHDIEIDIQLDRSRESLHLAYEDGRIGVVTAMAVFIIHPTFPDPSDLCTPPQIEVHRVISLNGPNALVCVNSLQMTPTALWLNWEIGTKEREPRYREPPWQPQNVLRRELMPPEAAYEAEFEKALDTGISEIELELEPGVENSFVFSVDFGL